MYIRKTTDMDDNRDKEKCIENVYLNIYLILGIAFYFILLTRPF